MDPKPLCVCVIRTPNDGGTVFWNRKAFKCNASHMRNSPHAAHTPPFCYPQKKKEVRGLNPELSFTSEVLHTSWFHRGLTPLKDSRLNLLRIEPQAPLRPDAGATPCAHATHGRPTSGPAWTSSCSYPGELEPLCWRIEQRSVFRPSADLE